MKNSEEVIAKISAIPEYQKQFKEVFGRAELPEPHPRDCGLRADASRLQYAL